MGLESRRSQWFTLILAFNFGLLALPVAQTPQTVTIDFEGLADRSAVTSQYASLGVTFSGGTILTCGLSLNCPAFPPFSGAKVVYDWPATFGGVITATFTAAAGEVRRVSARVTGNTNVTMTAFGTSGAVLDVEATGGPNYAPVGTPNLLLTVEAPIAIAYVTFVDSGNTFTIDDFTFARTSLDLSIGAVQIAQTVFDPDINSDGRVDLVANKPAVVIATILASAVQPGDGRQLRVRATTGTQVVDKTIVMSEIPQQGKEVELYFTPAGEGPTDVKVTVDPSAEISESDESNNEEVAHVDVKTTDSLKVVYLKVDGCFPFGWCYGPVEQFAETVSRSSEFNIATFPVANYIGSSLSTGYLGDPIPLVGLVDDILSVGVWGRLADPSSDKAIGIVPQDYFAFHGESGTVGMTFAHFIGGLVTEGYWTTAAHELGHMFGITEEEYQTNPPNGGPASGFWVSRQERIENSICFMGTGGLRDFSRWIDTRHYNELFRELRAGGEDPEVLLVAGLLHEDGQVELRPWYFMPNGFATVSRPGTYAVRVLNAAGETLAEVTVPVSFTMHVEPGGVVPAETVPLLVAVPYPATAVQLDIVGANGQPLVSVRSSTKVLADAIQAIPDFGFSQNASQRRQTLLNKVNALERALAAGSTKGALQKLQQDLRKHVQAWLVDGYVKREPVQIEKAELLAVIDAMVERLRSLVK